MVTRTEYILIESSFDAIEEEQRAALANLDAVMSTISTLDSSAKDQSAQDVEAAADNAYSYIIDTDIGANPTISSMRAALVEHSETHLPDLQEIPVTGSPFFGMEIEKLEKNWVDNQIIVTTTGAVYNLTTDKLEMTARIDPATNDYSNPEIVAQLDFYTANTNLVITSIDKEHTIIDSDIATFDFYSDSLFSITTKQSVQYKHTNLMDNVEWLIDSHDANPTKVINPDFHKQWAGPRGGSLYTPKTLPLLVNSTISRVNDDASIFTIGSGEAMLHTIFPPKLYDFENLYGVNKAPNWRLIFFGNNTIPGIIADIQNLWDNDHIGVYALFENIWTTPEATVMPDGRLGYIIKPTAVSRVEDLIAAAHAIGAKVLLYFVVPAYGSYAATTWWDFPAGHPRYGEHQTWEETAQVLKDLTDQFGTDGWYMDGGLETTKTNLAPRSAPITQPFDYYNVQRLGPPFQDYLFTKKLRRLLGDDAILLHQSANDPWGGGGTTAIGHCATFMNCYCQYTFSGETGKLFADHDSPAVPYYRYFQSGYGMGQNWGTAFRLSTHIAAISYEEMHRMVIGSGHGVGMESGGSDYYDQFIKYIYKLKKAAYQAGTMSIAPDWPIDTETGWFRTATNVQKTNLTDTTVTISWETNWEANGEVAYIETGDVWWQTWTTGLPAPHDIPANVTVVTEVGGNTTSHSVEITGLTTVTSYDFRIRSNTGQPNADITVAEKTIWGAMGTFTTL